MDNVKQQRLELGKRIKAKRIENNMTLQELAKKMGYEHRSSISKLENGENSIPQDKINQLAEALNTSVAYLMGWEEDHFEWPTLDEEDVATIKKMIEFDQITLSFFKDFYRLNFEGQDKVINYTKDLIATGLYTRNTDSKVG